MRRRHPLGSTRGGIAILGICGTAAFALLGAAMHRYPEVFEPLLRWVLPYLLARKGGGHYRYDPSFYELWAWMPLQFAAAWSVIFLVGFITKPAMDRRLDRSLRQRLEQSARGAPLEPD